MYFIVGYLSIGLMLVTLSICDKKVRQSVEKEATGYANATRLTIIASIVGVFVWPLLLFIVLKKKAAKTNPPPLIPARML